MNLLAAAAAAAIAAAAGPAAENVDAWRTIGMDVLPSAGNGRTAALLERLHTHVACVYVCVCLPKKLGHRRAFRCRRQNEGGTG